MKTICAQIKRWKIFLQGRTIDQNKEEVRKRNFDFLRAFSIMGVCTTLFTTIYGQIMQDIVTFNTEFLILFLYFLIMFAVLFFRKKHTSYITAELYLWLTPLMIMGILMGTFLDPFEPSITIMVFICILPLFILDKPWRVLLFITFTAVVYTICCYIAKSKELFVKDMIDLVLFYHIGIGINYLILKDRMSNVEYAAAMLQLSERDALTAIYNRGAGEKKIKELVAEEQYGMFCIIDIDDFKSINDKYGHMIGDKVLKLVAKQLCANFGEHDIVLRMGGDEFAVYAIGVTEIVAGAEFAKRLFQSIENLSIAEFPDCKIAISLGGAFFALEDKKQFEELYHEGDVALYKAKRSGKGKYGFASILTY